MFTPDERRAVLFLAVVAVAGAAVRAARPAAGAPAAPGPAEAAEIAPQLAPQDPARQAARSLEAERRARPLGAGERVDVDRAAAAELDRLPRIGPVLAQRIVADRERRGPFGSLAALGRVPGIGPRVLEALQPLVSFSGTPAGAAPDSGPPADPPPARSGDACPRVVVVNRATAAELACLPGIGPALAARIVAVRKVHGPFLDLAELAGVPGLGPRRVTRLANRLRVP